MASPSEEPIQDEPVEEKEPPLESPDGDLTGQAIIEEPVVEEQPASESAQLDL